MINCNREKKFLWMEDCEPEFMGFSGTCHQLLYEEERCSSHAKPSCKSTKSGVHEYCPIHVRQLIDVVGLCKETGFIGHPDRCEAVTNPLRRPESGHESDESP